MGVAVSTLLEILAWAAAYGGSLADAFADVSTLLEILDFDGRTGYAVVPSFNPS